MTAAALAAAALTLAGCDPWQCDFESHGACVEFETGPDDVASTKARMDALLRIELAYWGLHDLSGWRIQFRDTAQYTCYLTARTEGCTDYVQRTLSLRLRRDSLGCFEAAELLHELGHYTLGDPTHSNALWEGVDAQFAPAVWDRPDAAPACVARYEGIRSGMWPVNVDGF